jgi:ABC-2 type transport system ATP-binding protein
VKALSGGQRRRLDLALGLVGAPELLFLDEPTTGFDPAARHRAWDLVGRLRELGTTILLTTHYLEEAQRLADRVAVLRVITFRLPDGASAAHLPMLTGRADTRSGEVRVETRDGLRDTWRLTDWAVSRHIDLTDLAVTPPSLEDAYLALTGAGGDEH